MFMMFAEAYILENGDITTINETADKIYALAQQPRHLNLMLSTYTSLTD
jgi:hypothetical protein